MSRKAITAKETFVFRRLGEKAMVDLVNSLADSPSTARVTKCKRIRISFSYTAVPEFIQLLVSQFPIVEYVDYEGTDLVFMRELIESARDFPCLKELTFAHVNAYVRYSMYTTIRCETSYKVIFNGHDWFDDVVAVFDPRPRAEDYETRGYRCRFNDKDWFQAVIPAKTLMANLDLGGLYDEMTPEQQDDWIPYM